MAGLSSSGVDLGLLYTFRNPPGSGRDHHQNYRAVLDQMVAAEGLGYDTVWIGEHHFSADGHIPSPLVAAAALAARTERIRIGICLLPVSFYDPVRLAEDIAVIDVISGGRLDVGVGLGYVDEEFAGFGREKSERLGRFLEGIEILRGLWTEERFSFAGDFHRVGDADLQPRPIQSPHPPLWAGGTASRSIDRAAAQGFHFLATSDATVALYDEKLAAAGKDPESFDIWRPYWVHVAESDDQAWEEAGVAIHELLSRYGALEQEPDTEGHLRMVPPAAELREAIADSKRAGRPLLNHPLIGSPETVAAELVELGGRARVTHLCMGMDLPGLATELTHSSMRLFAERVAPQI
jgi:alkanesulfonate monooxygenase SsuD/methylene tetrahydromethanopterin reductase-like flavin-dependent oxidoreductase (luciferase family)